MEQNYNESSIKVLKGLEPVKQRPGMYTRTENPLHIIQEVLDNSADEALGGHATKIKFTLHKDGSASVQDNGRGIPVGIHAEEKVPAIQLVFTQLHSGGKFEKDGESAYAFSGGLHGVGVSVSNALSTRLEATVVRDGAKHQIVFENGDLVEPLKQIGEVRGHGTSVRLWPDPKYFDTATIPVAELERLLRSKAMLLPGLEVTYLNEYTDETLVWKFDKGLEGYLSESLRGDPVVPVISGERFASKGQEDFNAGEGASFSITFTEDGLSVRESYVNLIPTPAGGTHEAGLRDALYLSVKSFIELRQLMPKNVKLMPEDVFSRVSYILSAKVLDPQFQGQTKDKLTSRETLKVVSALLKPFFELWLNEHTEHAKKIAELALKAAAARSRSEGAVEKRKGSGAAVLPGKLTDCETTDINRNELFLVEGDSAGGSAKQARDRDNQALLPLRGKVLNTWEIPASQIFSNTEVHDIAVGLGVDPHTVNDELDLKKLRYGKVIIMSDADVDGSHIQVLLMALFLKHFPQLVIQGRLYVAQPPLFRIDAPASKGKGGSKQPRKFYALDQSELTGIEEKLRHEGLSEDQWRVSRFKGLGEMNPDQLRETTMSPDTRKLMQIQCTVDDWQEMNERMTMLMGKAEASGRRAWLEEHGHETDGDI